MNASLLTALLGFGGVLAVALALVFLFGGRKTSDVNSGTDVSQWGGGDDPPFDHGHH